MNPAIIGDPPFGRNPAIIGDPPFGRSDVHLSPEEKARMFYWCRDQAYDALTMARHMKRMGNCPPELSKRYMDEAMIFLSVARSVFPLTEHGETISIDDIINGKEPPVSP